MDDFLPWRRFGIHNEHHVYQIYDIEIRRWVESQPSELWKPYVYAPIDYVFTPQFEMLFRLRWE